MLKELQEAMSKELKGKKTRIISHQIKTINKEIEIICIKNEMEIQRYNNLNEKIIPKGAESAEERMSQWS